MATDIDFDTAFWNSITGNTYEMTGDVNVIGGSILDGKKIILAGYTLTIPVSLTFNNYGTLELNSNSGSELIINGELGNESKLLNRGGTITNNNIMINNSNEFNNYLDIINNGTFTNNKELYHDYGTITNNGTFTNNDGGSISNYENIINNGTFISKNGSYFWNYSLLINNGTITTSHPSNIENYSTRTILSNSVIGGAGITNYGNGIYYKPDNTGLIEITDSFTLPVGSSFTVKSGQTLQINSNQTFTNSGAITNGGAITNIGTINNNNSMTNNGTITNESVLNNKDGTITIQTSSSLVNGTSSNAGFIGNSGTITNNGTLDNTNGTILSNDQVSGTAPTDGSGGTGTYYYAGNYSGANEIIPLNNITIPANGYFTINNGNKMRFNSSSTTFTNNGTFHIQPNAMLQPETLNNNHRIINEGVILSYTGQLVSSTSSTFQNNGYIMINLATSIFTFNDLENNGTILSNNVTTKNGTTTDNGNIFEPNGSVIEIDSDFTMPKLDTTYTNMTVIFIVEGGKTLQINSAIILTNNGTIYNNRVGSQIINNGTIINNSSLSNGAYPSNTIVNTNGTILSNQSYDSKISGGTYYYPDSSTGIIDITSDFAFPLPSTFNVPDGKTLNIPNGVHFYIN